MSTKTLLAGAAVLLAVVLGAGAYYYYVHTLGNRAQDTKAVQSALNTLTATTTVTVPSANPLNSVKPTANPLGATNPFNHVYKNPFQ